MTDWIITLVSIGGPTLLLTILGLIGWGIYKEKIGSGANAWIQVKTVLRIVGFIAYALVSHVIVLLVIPNSTAAAAILIFFLIVGGGAIAYATWEERTHLESFVYWSGVVILIAAYVGVALVALNDSKLGQSATGTFHEFQKEIVDRINKSLDEKKGE